MLFINGHWKPASGTEFHSTNPATEEILWTGQAATTEEISTAVNSARDALPDWNRLGVEKRSEYLEAFRQQLEKHKTSLARCISEETGKPLWDASTEVQAMIGKINVSIAALQLRRSPLEFSLTGGVAATRYKPHGVLAVYGPFNFPGHIANGQIVPALAAGNTIVFKPSEQTPRVAEETVKLWEQAGLPPGVLNLVQGARSTGEALANHKDLHGVLFTGSLQTGIALRRTLLEQPEKILVLELGGNNPLVVHRVDDVPAAAYWTVISAFISAGQRCTCARRLIVTDGNAEFLDQLVTFTQKLQVAAPDANPQPFFGPLINATAAQRVLQEQQRLIASGGVSLGEARGLELGNAYVTPGIVDVTDCTACIDQEIFGPLLQVTRVPDLSAAIRVANQTQYGLVAALFSESRDDFETFYDEIQAGLINWNRPTTGASGQLPFGGVGRSGNHRPAGSFAVDFCNVPIASLESESLSLPAELSPGVQLT